jgi:hypothetical protein
MSDSDSDEPAAGKSKSSRMLKAKKWLGSKTAGSKVGRKAIGHFLGKSGELALDALVDVCTKEGGKDRGKSVKDNIYKMALKSKILHDSGLLNAAAIVHLVEPTNFMMLQLVESLAERAHVDVSVLVHLLKRIRKQAVLLLQPHISTKNVDLLIDTLDYVGSERFLNALLNDKKCRQEKEQLSTLVSEMATPYLESRGGDFGGDGVCRAQVRLVVHQMIDAQMIDAHTYTCMHTHLHMYARTPTHAGTHTYTHAALTFTSLVLGVHQTATFRGA